MRIIEFSAPTGQTISIVLYKRFTDVGIPIGTAVENSSSKTTYTIAVPDSILPDEYRILGFRPNGRVLASQFVEIRSTGTSTAYDIVLSDVTQGISTDISDTIVETIKNELRNTTIVVGAETKVLGPCKERKTNFNIDAVTEPCQDTNGFDISKVVR